MLSKQFLAERTRIQQVSDLLKLMITALPMHLNWFFGLLLEGL